MAFFIIVMFPLYVCSSVFSLLHEPEDSALQDLSALRERCEKQSKELYKHFDSRRVPLYQHYYHEKLNKCFVVISNKNNTEKYLYEVDDNETKIHGIFIKVGNSVEFCLVSNKGYQFEKEEDISPKSYTKCKSLSEWNKQIKPYTEE